MRIILYALLCVGLLCGVAAADPTARATKVSSVPTDAQVLIDYDGGTNPVYVGWADRGIATSAAAWYIIKITYSGDNPTAVKSAHDAIWDNRASLTYA